MKSPCLTCTRVRDPKNCENKNCKDWQAWFLDRWEAMRRNVRAQMEKKAVTESGVPLGGNRYASPHRVRDYLDTDPCSRCLCPKDLCQSPCPAKTMWNDKQSGVNA